ncbi:MFS transporter [Aspergillus saccharolyticus JOP 1030-1]|uniref:MFS multidrug transporter n=1 Tax=Aspergillus saccharolyticus JOP 1030-1 TaxID=1450539 RepID=A0A318ZRX6_9EURO|nr:MFS multidrug transporter [Aspergillus saccharolyticus JOP 1030-1]PYH47113.1 MFS multidrug transporter [Aspergillus saccharolyticus JOP 1030-1]
MDCFKSLLLQLLHQSHLSTTCAASWTEHFVHMYNRYTADIAGFPEDSAAPAAATLSRPLFPETDLSQGIVGWDGQDDPNNPQNFANGRKWGLLALISSITFISPLASSMFSPAVSYVGDDFGVSNEYLLSFSVTIFLLGYTFGPLFLAPLSEIYGRRIVLSCANWFFVVWQIGCALAPNISALIVFRLFAGMGGVGSLTLGAGVIADLFPTEQRGMATSIWALGPLIGPVAGPIAGGFIGETIGWRWVFWILLIASGVISMGIEVLNRETYAPVLIRWKTERLAKELNRTDLRSAYDKTTGQQRPSVAEALKLGLSRPIILLFKSPIVLMLSIYMAFVYGLLYLFFTTISTVFQEDYGWSTGISGLAYLGIGIGFLTGLTLIAFSSDRIVAKLTARNAGKFEPEMRLVTMIFFSCILPISFFWYGWSAKYKTHWIVPIIGMAPFGIGMMGIYMPIQTYVIDCYPAYAASANAALTATRSLVGALLPLAGPAMFDALGLGWGNSLLGFIALAFVPVPILFNRYGKGIREKFPVDLEGKKGK